jgi:hypothetical protein
MEVLTHICTNLSSILNKLNKITTIYIYIVVIFDNDTTYSDTWEDPDQGLQEILLVINSYGAICPKFDAVCLKRNLHLMHLLLPYSYANSRPRRKVAVDLGEIEGKSVFGRAI